VFNQMYDVFDHTYALPDRRYKIAKLHRHLTATGEPGASGKYDPKTITTPDGIKYEQMLREPGAVCEVCESGDMIFPWRRFKRTHYRPGILWCVWVHVRATIKL
jgi:hypothetical protein